MSSRKPLPAHPEITRARRLLQAGQPDQAQQICNQVLATEPGNAGAYNVLGGIAVQQGRPELAVGYFSKAIELDSSQPSFHQGLGIAYCNLGQLPDAVPCFRQAIALDPKDPAAHSNLGNCFQQGGDLAEATRSYRKAISVNSTYLPAYLNLAGILDQQRDHKTAVKTYEKALRAGADTPENQASLVLLHHRLGLALRQLEQTDEAIVHYNQAIARQPDFALAHNSLGGALLARNDLDAAMDCFRKALEIEPGNSRVHSNLLLTMNYFSGVTQKQLYEESLKFDSQHARGLLQGRKPFRNSRNKKKVLRIGYLSPDFREHSVAFFTRKLPGQHNREAVTVYCYADVDRPDDLTGQFQTQTDHWLSITAMENDEVAARIRQDGIDILIDLAGHTANNRLLVFARKPAPIQVSWLGYPNTTGIKVMDYRLTDAVADPNGDADPLHAEKLVRLEHGFLCYQNDESIPVVSPPPCLKQGHVTFGSFNTIKKVTSEVVRVWSQILTGTPGARLIMKANALEDETTKTRLLQAFGENGITRDRIDLVNATPHRKDHMKVYSKVDISLDPFPYNGTTTTCEALWMGVPVISLRGNRHAGRVGASIHHHIGLTELTVDSEDEYVALAKRLAGDTERLVTLRKALRPQIRESTLMNLPLFTETLEDAYRKMWVTWCNAKR
ncbi:MAG: tetratricopeptide repeat protein [Gammaproteobacteria bacterium]|nr:tetratricopeptide repeat protein [Gammaproteobacteria bacterium]